MNRRLRVLVPVLVALLALAWWGNWRGRSRPFAVAPVPAERRFAPVGLDRKPLTQLEAYEGIAAAADAGVWLPERMAERYEETVVQFWDALRMVELPLELLAEFPANQFKLPTGWERRELDHGIVRYGLSGGVETLTPGSWRARAH